MTQENRNDELYILYAQFLINFEHVSHVMRFGILYILFPQHTDRETRQMEILMEGLTADQIRSKFMALITEDFKPETEVFKLSKTISNVYERIIPTRNSFAHGTSFVGTNDLMKASKEGQILLRHPKLKKTGLDLNFKKFEVDTLKLGFKLFEKLRYAVGVIAVIIRKANEVEQKTSAYNSDQYLQSTRTSIEELETKFNSLLNK